MTDLLIERPAFRTPPAIQAGLGDGAEVAAWKFDCACVLQSDIVGFTSLGSRISPEQLCGCVGPDAMVARKDAIFVR